MPPACFPFALLFLDCDNEEVDVNVHPSKTEVRFRHQSWVHDLVRDAVRDQLMLSRPAPSFSPNPQPAAALPYSEFSQMMQNEAPAPEFVLHAAPPPPERFNFDAPPIAVPAAQTAAGTAKSGTAARLRLKIPDTHGGFPAEAMPPEIGMAGSMVNIAELRPLGQLHNSFIIAAGATGSGSSTSTWRMSAFCSSRYWRS